MAHPISRLEMARRSQGFTQWGLARASGIVQFRLSVIEREYVRPNETERQRIAQALRLAVEDLWPEAEQ